MATAFRQMSGVVEEDEWGLTSQRVGGWNLSTPASQHRPLTSQHRPLTSQHRPLTRQSALAGFSPDNQADSCFLEALDSQDWRTTRPGRLASVDSEDPPSPTKHCTSSVPDSSLTSLRLASLHLSSSDEIAISPSPVTSDKFVYADVATSPGALDFLPRPRQGSIVDGLLHEIYDHWHLARHDSLDSDTMTECSSTSDVFYHHRHDMDSAVEKRLGAQFSRSFLQSQSVSQLQRALSNLQRSVAVMNVRLVKQLKRRDRRLAKQHKNCDIVTAVLQAASLKRQIDTRMKFSLQPGPSAFDQWRDAMKAVCRLPLGIPPEFRKKVWLSLAEHYLFQLKINWEKTVRFVFNERSNPDDDKLGMQIVKDLHRTGCSRFSGEDNDADRAVLKRLLLAYARWNKRVGYCQGFNVIAALLLNVMDNKEDDALKVMIYLIDSVLPESYFANNLRALSVDMAVFRDLLRITYPRLSKHLDTLQLAAQDIRTGACYEPPLTNVFTMQWFLTLFATCLPVDIVLRVWDSILLEGSEILLRTALGIWGKLAKRIMSAHSADEFYSLMGELSSSIMQGTLFTGDTMIKSVYSFGDFPFPNLHELREKYTYDIRPFTPPSGSAKKSSSRSMFKSLFNSDEDELDDEDITAMACMPGDVSASDISVMGPGVYSTATDDLAARGGHEMERMSTDINSLKLQYDRLKERQQQAHIIIAAASAKKSKSQPAAPLSATPVTALVPSIESPTAMNHLFVGKTSRGAKNQMYTDGPRISAPPNSGLLAKQLQAVAKAKAVSKCPRMRSGKVQPRPAVISPADDSDESVETSSTPCVSSVVGGEDREQENCENSRMVDQPSSPDHSPGDGCGQNMCHKPAALSCSSPDLSPSHQEEEFSQANSFSEETVSSANEETTDNQPPHSESSNDIIRDESVSMNEGIFQDADSIRMSDEADPQSSGVSPETVDLSPSPAECLSQEAKDDSGVDSPSVTSPARSPSPSLNPSPTSPALNPSPTPPSLNPGSSRVACADEEMLLSVKATHNVSSPASKDAKMSSSASGQSENELKKIVSVSMEGTLKDPESTDTALVFNTSYLSEPVPDANEEDKSAEVLDEEVPLSPTFTVQGQIPAFTHVSKTVQRTQSVDSDDHARTCSKQLVSRRIGQKTMVVSQKPYNLAKPIRQLSNTHVTSDDPNMKPVQPGTAKKAFNPFPMKHLNSNRVKNGLKLGLYSASTIDQLRGLKTRSTST